MTKKQNGIKVVSEEKRPNRNRRAHPFVIDRRRLERLQRQYTKDKREEERIQDAYNNGTQ